MTQKEKIIRRLHKGFGYDIPFDAKWKTNQAHGHFRGMGANSWYFCDTRLPFHYNVGSCDNVKECLRHKRWVINPRTAEISEYIESLKSSYVAHEYLIEEL